MTEQAQPVAPHTTIAQYFGDLPDPRTGPAKLHVLLDLLTIALLAVICGEDDWVAVHDFGVARETWMKTFLALPHGIPSHDTFEHTDYGIAHPSRHTTVEKGHGRLERRQYAAITAPDYLAYFDPDRRWEQLKSVIRVERERTRGEVTERQVHYYIASLAADARVLAGYIRSHWHIEHKEHWLLDVTFHEDDSRARAGFEPENLAVLRHLALNLLKREATLKRSIKGKRFTAALDQTYLLKVLLAGSA